jgi:signal transduction histidine kinase
VSVPRGRILVYVAAALTLTVTVWAVAWSAVERAARQRHAEAQWESEQLVQVFERQVRSLFRYGDAYVKMVRREYLRGGGLDAVRAVMEDVPLDRALVSHVTILDAAGTPVFNSGFALRPGVSAGDRDYFLQMRDGAAAGGDPLYISLPHRGRNSGNLVVRLVRRVSDADGAFRGVVFAALDADAITEFFRAANLGPRSSATLVGLDRRIRARSSYGRLGPGQDISDSRIWRELEQRARGSYLQTSVVDAVTRHYAYSRLEEFPLVVAIGVAVDDLAQQLAGYRTPTFLIAALATVLIVLVTLLVLREVLAAERLRASEASVRAMHDQLEQRVRERTEELSVVQEELLRKERLAVLGQLTGSVAHELRNPLSTIDTSLAVLERRMDMSGDDLARPVERIHRNVHRCNAIIGELLDFARARSAPLEPTVLDEWLREVVGELDASGGVPVRFEPGTGHASVPLERDRLRRAIINLVDNARDALGDGSPGAVTVRTRVDGARAEIEVSDEGPGISPELLTRIREPLFSTKSFGVGLGLPIVEQIVDEHGGGFELASEQGSGTRAVLWLPLGQG